MLLRNPVLFLMPILVCAWASILHFIMHQHDQPILSKEDQSVVSEVTQSVKISYQNELQSEQASSRLYKSKNRLYFNLFQIDDPTMLIDISRPWKRVPLRFNYTELYVESLCSKTRSLYLHNKRDNLNITQDIIYLDGANLSEQDVFRGVVTSMDKLGLPPLNVRSENSDQVLELVIRSEDGIFYIVQGFESGKHAERDLELLVGQEITFPTDLYHFRLQGWKS